MYFLTTKFPLISIVIAEDYKEMVSFKLAALTATGGLGYKREETQVGHVSPPEENLNHHILILVRSSLVWRAFLFL